MFGGYVNRRYVRDISFVAGRALDRRRPIRRPIRITDRL